MSYLIKNATCVNEGKKFNADLLVKNGRIERIDNEIAAPNYKHQVVNAEGLLLLPGAIDDQVHFREPGLTHKAEIYTEAKAAVAGGVTSFMEMPNTNPQTTTKQALEAKFQRASQVSLANYSFFFGATNDNLEEVLRVDKNNVCGVKIFMGSSTGNMLVDNEQVLEKIFANCDHLIATHCEVEGIIRANTQKAIEQFGEDIPFAQHPIIRSEEACYKSSEYAYNLAQKHGTRLHILHISTGKETNLFSNELPLSKKRITTEACVHHLWFTDEDYEQLGSLIKCNPAIKKQSDRDTVFKALLDNKIDIIATDHAPHTWDEKQAKYLQAPSGLPLVQHSLQMMLEHAKAGRISIERVVEKMCHAPAECFNLMERGYLREGYMADLVLVDPNKSYQVSKSNILFKCAWSPLEGTVFSNTIHSTFVNGNRVYHLGDVNESTKGERLTFSN